ncbi:MAG TPA: serine/threonine-protein kinase [Myxococcaceae bacterium]|nr:serine/threonine-protein kinase [Myxococcaceae bacterium]
MSQQVAATPTETVGDFRLLRPLGKGGMGEVWLAEDPHGERRVIKRLLASAAEDPRFLKRFLLEGRYASLLRHPNVVGVTEVGESDGLPYLVLEYVDGTDLRKVKKGARARRVLPPIGAVVDAILQACHGLHAAHELADPETGRPLKLMHRDVSPDNLLLDRSGVVRISDFGIARAEGQALTSNGALWGKHSYMAPERLQGKEADRRVDIFSLGVVFFELLALERPFSSKAKGGAIAAVLFEAPRPLAKLVPDLPPSIVAVVSRMLEKDPDQRYATCAEVAEALEAARAGTELLGTSADLLEFAADASAAADDGSGGEPVTRAARKSRALRQSQALERAQLEQAVAQDAAAEGAPDAEDEDADAGETRDQATEAVRAGAREATAPLPPSVVRELEAAKAARAEAQARAEAAAARAVAPAAVAPAVKAPPAAPGLPLPLIIGAAVLVLGLLAYFLF